MKVDFIDQDNFVIYYIGNDYIKSEEGMRIFFKMLNNHLKKKYDYEFCGLYNVNIYCHDNVMVLVFENIDDYGQKDFDITMFVNSVLLYEFEDSELILGKKIYYEGKYYVEIENAVDDICLFEYGNIIYGNKIDEVLNRGILLSI